MVRVVIISVIILCVKPHGSDVVEHNAYELLRVQHFESVPNKATRRLAATNNHQELNARVVEKAGGAVVVTESELSPERLAGVISEVLADPQRAERMGASAKQLALPDATKSIVDLIAQIQRD